MTFCSNCGKEVNDSAKFCDGCGNMLNGGAATSQAAASANYQTPTYQAPGIKTPLDQDEKIIIQQTATSFNSMPRISGKMTLTNQRLIWEKSGLANIAGLGLLSLAGDKYMCVPLTEISSVNSTFILGASGLEFSTTAGLKHKFSLNGLKHKQSAEIIIDYINKHISA